MIQHPDFDETGKADETVNEISLFNKEFKTALIRPITYRFDEDKLSINHRMNYDVSIMEMGLDKYYDLPKFKVTVAEEGLNFFNMGSSANITKDKAISVFQKYDPSQPANSDALLKYIKKSM